jgi:hypothetical protein
MRAIADVKLARMADRLLTNVSLFSRFVVGRALRPYQLEPARAVMESVTARRGETISVMMSRQAGKNELSAHLEAYLLSLHRAIGGQIVKCAPTCRPRLAVSRLRLEWVLENPLTHGLWRAEPGGLRLGEASIRFLPAEPGRDAVGAAASLLLEVDAAQDVDPDEHDRGLATIAAPVATRVYYGTAWRGDDLLQRAREENLARERRDGVRRHFEFPWEVVAAQSSEYARHVAGERARLGDDHPLFRAQYRLETLGGETSFLTARRRELMRGDHARRHAPEDGSAHVAGVALAGPTGDFTVVTIARVVPAEIADGVVEPSLEVVEHLRLTGGSDRSSGQALLAALRDVWRCRRVVVDAAGAGLTDHLRGAIGDVVRPFVFTAESASRLGFAFLAAVNGGRFRMYGDPAAAGDADGCAAELWREATLSRCAVRRGQRIAFWVPGGEGEDGFLLSAALCAWAGRDYVSPPAMAPIRPRTYLACGR